MIARRVRSPVIAVNGYLHLVLRDFQLAVQRPSRPFVAPPQAGQHIDGKPTMRPVASATFKDVSGIYGGGPSFLTAQGEETTRRGTVPLTDVIDLHQVTCRLTRDPSWSTLCFQYLKFLGARRHEQLPC